MADSSNLAEFRRLYPKFVALVVRVTKRRQKDITSDYRLGHDFKFGDHTWSTVPRRAAPYDHCLPDLDDPVFRTDDALTCAEGFFLADLASDMTMSREDGTAIENPGLDNLRFFIFLRLLEPIRHLFARSRGAQFSRRQILTCLDHYIEIWKGQPQVHPGFAPIYNLDSDIRAIKLTDLVSLVRFTDDMKSRLINETGPFGHAFDIRSYSEASHVAKFTPPENLPFGTNPHDLTNRARLALQSAITSLRLTKLDPVGTPGFIQIPRFPGTMLAQMTPLESYDLPVHGIFPHDRYTLARKDLGRFRGHYRLLSQNQFAVWKTLDLPLQQFNRSCQRLREEDKILDYAICLESTLLADVRDELSYRLALRAGTLLRSRCDPKRVFTLVRSLYEVRSRIVHSNEKWGSPAIRKVTDSAGMEPQDYMPSIGQLVRDFFSKIIEEVSKGRRLPEVCKELDSRIIGSL